MDVSLDIHIHRELGFIHFLRSHMRPAHHNPRPEPTIRTNEIALGSPTRVSLGEALPTTKRL